MQPTTTLHRLVIQSIDVLLQVYHHSTSLPRHLSPPCHLWTSASIPDTRTGFDPSNKTLTHRPPTQEALGYYLTSLLLDPPGIAAYQCHLYVGCSDMIEGTRSVS